MAIRTFTIVIDVPRGATITDMKEHIRDAVGAWGGSGDPDGPLFDLCKRIKSVKHERAMIP